MSFSLFSRGRKGRRGPCRPAGAARRAAAGTCFRPGIAGPPPAVAVVASPRRVGWGAWCGPPGAGSAGVAGVVPAGRAGACVGVPAHRLSLCRGGLEFTPVLLVRVDGRPRNPLETGSTASGGDRVRGGRRRRPGRGRSRWRRRRLPRPASRRDRPRGR